MADIDVKDFTLGTAKTVKTTTISAKEYPHHIDADPVAGAAIAKAEDAAHSSGDYGYMALGVRTDTRASLAATTGDYVPPQMTANGDLRVRDDDLNTLVTSLAPTQATFAIANAAYGSGDCVSTAQTFTSVGASGKQVMIVGATLSIDHTTAIASAFRLHMFNAAKATPLADNDPHTVLSADLAKYLGYIDLGIPVDLGTICWVAQNGLAIPVKLSTANIVAQLEIITGLTPAASNLQVTLFTVPMS